MLVQSKYKEGEILAFRLTTGEEMLGKLVEEDAYKFVVKKPATIVSNGQGVGLQPSMLSMDINNSIDVQKSGITFVTHASEQFKNAYIQSTSSIKMAGANDLDVLQGSETG